MHSEIREEIPLHVLVERIGNGITQIEALLSASDSTKAMAEPMPKPSASLETKITDIATELEMCDKRLGELHQRLRAGLERI